MIIATIPDFLLAKIGPAHSAKLQDRLLDEARSRYPYCDLRFERMDASGCWLITGHGFIDGEATEKPLALSA